MASMLAGMGGMAGLQQMMGGMGGAGMPAFNPEGAADEPEDDDVPELVENFEQAAQ
jgi:nascent polypeptide-associated complex subunit beta